MELGPLRVLALSGGEWVIHLLMLCSVWAMAVMTDRALVFRKEKKSLARLDAAAALRQGDRDKAARSCAAAGGAAARVLSAALEAADQGPGAAEERAAAARIREKALLERRLLVLGSLGSNAPFIGLFGTVLGVIKAFHDLAVTQAAGPEVVMQGLSEALVATAVGLLVAMPSVMAYNYFQKAAGDILSESDALVRELLAGLKRS